MKQLSVDFLNKFEVEASKNVCDAMSRMIEHLGNAQYYSRYVDGCEVEFYKELARVAYNEMNKQGVVYKKCIHISKSQVDEVKDAVNCKNGDAIQEIASCGEFNKCIVLGNMLNRQESQEWRERDREKKLKQIFQKYRGNLDGEEARKEELELISEHSDYYLQVIDERTKKTRIDRAYYDYNYSKKYEAYLRGVWEKKPTYKEMVEAIEFWNNNLRDEDRYSLSRCTPEFRYNVKVYETRLVTYWMWLCDTGNIDKTDFKLGSHLFYYGDPKKEFVVSDELMAKIDEYQAGLEELELVDSLE